MKTQVSKKDAWAIRGRLVEYAETRYKSWYQFIKRSEISPSTANGWKNVRKNAVPDTPVLLELARRFQMSLDWLLLGRGAPDLGTSKEGGTLEDELRSVVYARLVGERGKSDAVHAMVSKALPPGAALIDSVVREVELRLMAVHGATWWHSGLPALAEKYRDAPTESKKRFFLKAIESGLLTDPAGKVK